MDWFYAQNGEQKGPVSEFDLRRLAGTGVVSQETLVWRSGMSQWEPYRTAAPPAPPPVSYPVTPTQTPLRFCNSCGLKFAATDLAVFGEATICASCQPAYVQRLRQGMTYAAAPAFRYGGFWIRVVATIIDGVVLQVVQFVILASFGLTAFYGAGNGTPDPDAQVALVGLVFLIVLALHFCYFVIFWSRTGATLGYMALGLKLVRPDGSPVSVGQAIGRWFSYALSVMILGFGLFMAGWDDQKRALHDRICETRVIRTR
jgi:uncharacterized RDD family membrane protein YckC